MSLCDGRAKVGSWAGLLHRARKYSGAHWVGRARTGLAAQPDIARVMTDRLLSRRERKRRVVELCEERMQRYEREMAVCDQQYGDEVVRAVDEAVRSGPGFKHRIFAVMREAITQVRAAGGRRRGSRKANNQST